MPTNNYIKIGLWLTALLLLARCAWSMPSGAYGFCSASGEAISIAFILLIFYEQWLWKFNPCERKPRLLKKYVGFIQYTFQGEQSSKLIDVSVTQTCSSVSIRIATDEITSKSVTSHLALENGEYVLYYTYITNPKDAKRDKNPIQYGTCRLIVDDHSRLHGFYWTTQKTRGDIYFIDPNKKTIEL